MDNPSPRCHKSITWLLLGYRTDDKDEVLLQRKVVHGYESTRGRSVRA